MFPNFSSLSIFINFIYCLLKKIKVGGTYLGCYIDNSSRDLQNFYGDLNPNGRVTCVAACKGLGYLYAGTQFRYDKITIFHNYFVLVVLIHHNKHILNL